MPLITNRICPLGVHSQQDKDKERNMCSLDTLVQAAVEQAPLSTLLPIPASSTVTPYSKPVMQLSAGMEMLFIAAQVVEKKQAPSVGPLRHRTTSRKTNKLSRKRSSNPYPIKHALGLNLLLAAANQVEMQANIAIKIPHLTKNKSQVSTISRKGSKATSAHKKVTPTIPFFPSPITSSEELHLLPERTDILQNLKQTEKKEKKLQVTGSSGVIRRQISRTSRITAKTPYSRPNRRDIQVKGLATNVEVKANTMSQPEFAAKKMVVRLAAGQILPELPKDKYKNTEMAPQVQWKGLLLNVTPDMSRYSELTKEEVSVCRTLRLLPAQYLDIKTLLIQNWHHSGPFNKTAAQKMCRIDVNKTGKLYEWFARLGWFSV